MSENNKPKLDLSACQIMGVLNITPDSFSDGGKYFVLDDALKQSEKLIAEGASMVDVGGESTRPNAEPVSLQEELDRVIPVVEALNAEFPINISIDTSKSVVMCEAIKAGAGFVNDVNALQGEGALSVVADKRVSVCLMHSQGNPKTMQLNPTYQDVVGEISQFLSDRIKTCVKAGIQRSKIVVDPGIGFGKTTAQNLCLLQNLQRFLVLQCPILVGVSRKSLIGDVLNVPVNERLCGGLALASLARYKGANIIRTHDVKETRDVLNMISAVADVKMI